jgi:DNA-binding NarL/FixJ family response regulator
VGVTTPGGTAGRVLRCIPVSVRVVLAHRSALIRAMLRVTDPARMHVVGETRSATELLSLCLSERPDAVLAGSALDDGRIEDVLDELVQRDLPVVVLSEDPSPERLVWALERGASGYLMDDCSPEQVVEALLAVAEGDAALHPVAAGTILSQWRRFRTESAAPAAVLTPRERDVLAAMARGLPAKAIGRELGMALKTVENHKIRIFDKLRARTQAQAVSLAIGYGLVPDAAELV